MAESGADYSNVGVRHKRALPGRVRLPILASGGGARAVSLRAWLRRATNVFATSPGPAWRLRRFVARDAHTPPAQRIRQARNEAQRNGPARNEAQRNAPARNETQRKAGGRRIWLATRQRGPARQERLTAGRGADILRPLWRRPSLKDPYRNGPTFPHHQGSPASHRGGSAPRRLVAGDAVNDRRLKPAACSWVGELSRNRC